MFVSATSKFIYFQFQAQRFTQLTFACSKSTIKTKEKGEICLNLAIKRPEYVIHLVKLVKFLFSIFAVRNVRSHFMVIVIMRKMVWLIVKLTSTR